MNRKLRGSFDKLQHQKRSVLSHLSSWSTARLTFRPDQNGWSALDVLDHLVKVESSILGAMRNNLPEGHPVTFKDKMGALLVTCVMRSPMRVKTPAAVAQVLPGHMAEIHLIATLWDEARDEMAAFLKSLPPDQLRRGVCQHPVSGWLTVPDAMRFLSAHLSHHVYQLNRLQRATRDL